MTPETSALAVSEAGEEGGTGEQETTTSEVDQGTIELLAETFLNMLTTASPGVVFGAVALAWASYRLGRRIPPSQIPALLVEVKAETLQNFISNVQYQQETGCWEWTGYADKRQGRPMFNGGAGWKGLCTRISYQWWRGEIDDERKCVVPTCGTRYCLNPDHLVLVEEKDAHRIRRETKAPSGTRRRGN